MFPNTPYRRLAGAAASGARSPLAAVIAAGIAALLVGLASGFHPWVVALCALLAAVTAGHLRGASPASLCLVWLLVAASALGVTLHVSRQGDDAHLPAFLGVTAFEVPMRPDRARALEGRVRVDLLSAEDGAPRAHDVYALVVPSLAPARAEPPGAPRRTNAPVPLEFGCTTRDGARRCAVSIGILGATTDYFFSLQDFARPPPGSIAVDDGARLVLRWRTRSEGARWQGERSIPVRVAPDVVRFGACAVPRGSARSGSGAPPRRISVSDIAFLLTDERCAALPVTDDDVLAERWLHRTASGGWDVPSAAFFEVTADHVVFVPLQGNGLSAELLHPAGTTEPPRPEIPLPATLPLRTRAFRPTSNRPADCATSWFALRERPWRGRAETCLRLDVQTARVPIDLSADGHTARLALGASLRPLGFMPLPQRSWRSEGTGEPTRFAYRHGDPQGAAADADEVPLSLPFRAISGPAYRATLRLIPDNGEARAQLLVTDGERRTPLHDRGALTLGSQPRAHLVFEVPPRPSEVLWPFVLPSAALALAVVLMVLLARGSPLPWAVQVAPMVAGVAAVFALGAAIHGLLTFGLIVHPPRDSAALDQLTLAVLLGPVACLGVVAFRPLVRRAARWDRRRSIAWLSGALLALSVARAVFALLRWEAIGPLRFVVVTPVLATITAALAWHTAAALRENTLAPRYGALVAVLLAATPVAWLNDKGALILLALPALGCLAGTLVALAERCQGRPRALGVTLAGALVALALVAVVFPAPLLTRLGFLGRNLEVPANRGVASEVCAVADAPATGGRDSVLEVLDRDGLLNPAGSTSSRRHPLRKLDWIEDGGFGPRAHALDRLPTREALEVGYVRALVERSLAAADGERRWPRENLLPAARGETNALLADYLGAVVAVPQLPRGLLLTIPMGLIALLVAAWSRRAKADGWWAAAVGAFGFLAADSLLTTAAQLDGLPNFAQNIPLIAVRGLSTSVLDALALGLGLACAGAHAVATRSDRAPGELQ